MTSTIAELHRIRRDMLELRAELSLLERQLTRVERALGHDAAALATAPPAGPRPTRPSP